MVLLSLIGTFNGWNGDLPLNETSNGSNIYTVMFTESGEVKFSDNIVQLFVIFVNGC